MTLRSRWSISPSLTPQANENLAAFPLILRQILFNRGYATDSEARAFLKAEILFDPSPFNIKGMQAAVDRIREAIFKNELIFVYGDYDVDGVTAAALLVQVLKALGGEALVYIPKRFDEGYGLNNDALDLLAVRGARLVISVDCGIRSTEEAHHARSLNMDLIITDHHEPYGELPDAHVVINPKQEGDPYPEKYLAGVGIAYKLAQALMSGVPTANDLALEDLLDLVALGTVADLAPLSGENRTLVRAGLKQIRQTKRQGLFSLSNVSGVPIPILNTTHIGFMLGPRLNAAGRLDSAQDAYDLLTTTDLANAGRLAQQLDAQNRARQELTRTMQGQAEILTETEDPESPILFAVDPSFNSGVVGLVAARLVENYYRPAIVGQISEEVTRCSCRSIPEFHITAALDECANLLVRHGGHAAAAGFTVYNKDLEELRERLQTIAVRELGHLDLRPTLTADIEVPLSELKSELLKNLEYLQPTGYGNREAVFVTRNLQVKSSRTVGAENKHLKLTLSDGRLTFDAIGFRLGHLMERLPGRIDVMYTFEKNEYNGRVSLQLNLKDLKPTGTPD